VDKSKIQLEKILKDKGVVTDEQITKAKAEAGRLGLTLEKSFDRLGIISEDDISMLVADTMEVPFVDLRDYIIDMELIKSVDEKTARKFKLIPIFKVGDTLMVAMTNPQDILAIDAVRTESKVKSVEPAVATESSILKAIDQYYGVKGSVKDVVREIDKKKMEELHEELGVKGELEIAEEAPVIKLVNILIMQAVKDRASDIHIEPDMESCRIRYRIDGILYEKNVFPRHLHSAIVSRIKIMSRLDIAEKRKPQDGKIQIKMQNKDLDLRVSSFPTVYGENIVMRLLDRSAALKSLSDLGMSKTDYSKFEKLIRQPYGIILVTGPTGSGKTTTLYAALSAINSIEKNIITIEDPVEYQIPMIRQTQINPKAGLTFATGLRSILRQDPDIIMVGEIRDVETAEIAIQAALTGHLVFSTLHTNDASGALTRLVDMGVEPFLISSSVIGILAQRLVRVICDKCKQEYKPSDEMVKDLKLEGQRKLKLYRGKGCDKCMNTGFTGRLGIFEMLMVDNDIRDMLMMRANSEDIKKKAQSKGMHLLREDGIEKVTSGITPMEEVIRVTQEL
jgi:type IV pilus assembly protein PilB